MNGVNKAERTQVLLASHRLPGKTYNQGSR